MHRVLHLIRTRTTVFMHDLVMIPLAWLGAYWLRFNLEPVPAVYLDRGLAVLGIVMICQGAVYWYSGLYRGLWRFASVPDLIRIIQAALAGTVVSASVIFLMTRMHNLPRSVFPLYAILLIGLLGGPRLVYRWFKDRRFYARHGRRVLIVGAGRAGEMLARDLLRESPPLHEPVGFVDDDRRKIGKELHGIRVLAECETIPDLVREMGVESILIAMPSASSAQMRRVVGVCETSGVPFRTLPRMQDLVTGQVGVKEVRDVRIEDLLGREKVTLDWDGITHGLTEKAILVTGGGGSIGSEICRQIARLKPARLIVYERSEFNLYKIDLELRRAYPGLELASVLGDICDAAAVDQVVRTHRPALVFHAAAYKHVPLLEHQARAAVLNNVFGTRCVADKANEYGCESFVLISSDKAVNPANVMGTTKRVAEIYCQNLNAESRTRFITVRFGNVLGSDGSVIPLFQAQIAAGGPVTVTHRDITRYFMTIPEASQLILQASVIGRGGEIFVLDMGEPVKISYLAEQLIRLSGRKPGEDIEIVYTGLRPGEKLYEELFHHAEMLAQTDHPKIMLAQSRQVSASVVERGLADMQRACTAMDERSIFEALALLVPEQVGDVHRQSARAETA
jgi:FlaA1/EpsC-like NDP-sugar epimerase